MVRKWGKCKKHTEASELKGPLINLDPLISRTSVRKAARPPNGKATCRLDPHPDLPFPYQIGFPDLVIPTVDQESLNTMLV